jgi:hypothetical protein
VRITIAADGSLMPAGSADYVTESEHAGGVKVRHYVCRNCLEVFDAPEGEEVVHLCAEGDPSSPSSVS